MRMNPKIKHILFFFLFLADMVYVHTPKVKMKLNPKVYINGYLLASLTWRHPSPIQ